MTGNMAVTDVIFSMLGMLIPLLLIVWAMSTLVRIRRAVERMATRLDAIDSSHSRI
jgi:hypothetical protein